MLTAGNSAKHRNQGRKKMKQNVALFPMTFDRASQTEENQNITANPIFASRLAQTPKKLFCCCYATKLDQLHHLLENIHIHACEREIEKMKRKEENIIKGSTEITIHSYMQNNAR